MLLAFLALTGSSSQRNLNLNSIKSIFFALLSSSVSRANLSCVVSTIFSSLAFLSTSVSMANLSCLLATTFSRYRDAVHRYRDVYSDTGTRYTDTGTWYTDTGMFLSNSFSSPRFNLLRVACRLFSLSSVTDDLFFFLL